MVYVDGGNERPDRADVARDQDALERVAPEHRFAAVEQLRIARERPHPAQLRTPAAADPEAQAVADERAQCGARHRVRAIEFAQADQHADREQQRQRRDDRAEHDHRVAERDREDHQSCGNGVRADPGDKLVEPSVRHRRIVRGGR
jgi:hypothetical protein